MKRDDTNIDAEGLWSRVQQALGVQTAPEMANLLGVTKQAAYEWQKGKLPGMDMLLRIAAVKGVSIHWLVTGRGHKLITVIDRGDSELARELAEENGISIEEQIGELVGEALQSRGLVKEKRSKTLDSFIKSFDSLSHRERRRVASQLIHEFAENYSERNKK